MHVNDNRVGQNFIKMEVDLDGMQKWNALVIKLIRTRHLDGI